MGFAVEENKREERNYMKGVRHLCESGVTEVPKKYQLPASELPILEDGKRKERYNISLPVIDLAQLRGSNRSQTLDSLTKACEDFGFFQVINHGIPCDIIKNMMDVSRGFFELPFEEREKYMSSDMSNPVRYGTSFNQNRDRVFSWRDFLKLNCHPSEHIPHWPSLPADFRQKAIGYVEETRKLFVMLVQAILESMGLREEEDEDEMLLREFEDGSQLMVVNCYPYCPQPELTIGMPPHSDYGFLTLLLQDGINGLQIQHQQQWFDVDPLPNSFVINVGDHLEIFSNGKYKSVLHRVLVNDSETRYSIASLHSLPCQRVVTPSPHLINKDNPRRYKDTDFATFMQYVTSCEPKKKNFIDSMKINCDTDQDR